MTNHKPRSESGFSLIETVAAMGVLAIAALPLMQVASGAANSAGRLETRLLARMVAENELSYAMSDPAPIDGGVTTGVSQQMARSFEWSLIAGPATSDDVQTLEISVRQEGDAQVLARLVGLKAVLTPVRIADDSPQSDQDPSDEEEEE